METLTLEDRKKLVVTNVFKMISSTNKEAVMELGDCTLSITGTNLEVTKLDLEGKQVELKGEVNCLKFSHKLEKVGLIKRIFK